MYRGKQLLAARTKEQECPTSLIVEDNPTNTLIRDLLTQCLAHKEFSSSTSISTATEVKKNKTVKSSKFQIFIINFLGNLVYLAKMPSIFQKMSLSYLS